MKMVKYYIKKISISVVFILISFCCFRFSPVISTVTIKSSETEIITRELNNESKYFEWIGIALIALAIWIWRKELNLTGIGPLSGPPIEQKDASEISSQYHEEHSPQEQLSTAQSKLKKDRFKKQKELILEMVQESFALNIYSVSQKLGITQHTAEAILFLLSKEGKLRQDGFPRPVYTLASGLDNLVLDHIHNEIKKKHEVISERRYVRIKNKYEADAIIKCVNEIFIVELKYIRSTLKVDNVKRTIDQLLAISKEYTSKNIILMLIYILFDRSMYREINKLLKVTTFDTGNIPLEVKILKAEDFKQK